MNSIPSSLPANISPKRKREAPAAPPSPHAIKGVAARTLVHQPPAAKRLKKEDAEKAGDSIDRLLKMCSWHGCGNAILQKIVKKAPFLKKLELDQDYPIEALKVLFENATQLEDLKLYHFSDEMIHILHLLPNVKTITSVILPEPKQLPGSLLARFPRSLTKIDEYIFDLTEEDLLAHLPPALEELEISGELVTKNVLENLPKGLKWLSLLDANGDDLNDALAFLPQSLTFLSIECSSITEQGVAHLSRLDQLLTLRIMYLDSDVFRYLPRSLVRLKIEHGSVGAEDMKNLPSSIRVLSFVDCEQKGEESLEDFPKDIVKLNFNSSSIPVKLFPQTVKNLNIQDCSRKILFNASLVPLDKLNASCCPVTDDDFEHLPPSLRYLNLGNCAITGEKFDKLPEITHLDLSYCREIKDEHLSKLPRSLIDLNLSHCEQIEGTNFDKLPQLKGIHLSRNSCHADALFKLPRTLEEVELYLTDLSADEFYRFVLSQPNLKHVLVLHSRKTLVKKVIKKVIDDYIYHYERFISIEGY